MNIYALLTYPQPIVDLDELDRSSSGFEYTFIRMTYQWTILILKTSLNECKSIYTINPMP